MNESMTRSINRLASVCHECLSVVYLLVCRDVYLSVYSTVCVCAYLSFYHSLYVCVSVCVCLCLSLSVCLRDCLSIGQYGRDQSLSQSANQSVCRSVDCACLRASVCLNLSVTYCRERAGYEASNGLVGLHPVIVD